MAGAYQSRKGKRGIVVEAVCEEVLWVWHLFVGAPGSLKYLNVMHQSPLYLDVTGGRWPPRNKSYIINGRTRPLPYYLDGGIYRRFFFLISPHPSPSTEEQTKLNCLQEAIRKDVELLFVVLMRRFQVALHPGRHRSVSQLVTTYKVICILHNMCVDSRLSSFLSRLRRGARAFVCLTLTHVARQVARRVVGMDRVLGSRLPLVLPPGDLHLSAAPPTAPAAPQPRWTTLTPPATHPLLCIQPPTSPPPALLPTLNPGLRHRTRRNASVFDKTELRTFSAAEEICFPCTWSYLTANMEE